MESNHLLVKYLRVSVLGPTLFLIYINDIVLNVKSEIRLFADDVLLYRAIRNPKDHEILQEDLNKWVNVWLMEFNIPKCSILQITTHLTKRNFTYKMNNIPLNTVLTILEFVYTTNYHREHMLITYVIRPVAYWVS